MKALEGKTAFVTGGSTGIGLGMARVFARAGMNVVITDIRDEALTSAQQILAEITDNVLALNVDSTDLAALERAADEIERTFGALHVLCNNAGVPGGAKVLETPEERWRATHEVNFGDHITASRHFFRGCSTTGSRATLSIRLRLAVFMGMAINRDTVPVSLRWWA